MPKRKLAALEKVDADLTNLQHKIKRDPASYRGEFQQQWLQYLNQREIFLANPTTSADTGAISFHDLIEFIAQVSDCYKDLTQDFPHHLIALLQTHHESLDQDLLTKIVGSLVLLRKKDIISSNLLLQTFFPLLTTTPSKSLRALLLTKILSDLRTSNSKTKAHKLNRNVQTLLTNLVTSDPTSSKSLWAIKITREMWKRQIWTDAPAVTIMQTCALSSNAKVIEAGVRFFLGGDAEREAAAEESDSDDNEVDMSKLRHQVGINKKSKKADRSLKKAAATVKRREKKKSAPHPLNFSALHLLHNPQGFAEDLFYRHLQNAAKAPPSAKLNLEAKLQVLQLVSRLIGLHKLTLLSFYSYHLTYLHPKQASVTTFLATLAQGTHSQVPPDVIEPLVQAIADRFVSEASAGEVAAAGLNAIREVCVRQPLAMNETLLQDLVTYRKSKDKGVMMAAKGLLGLFRQVDPSMLHRRDRGRDAALSLRDGTLTTGRFGEEAAGEIEGLDLLEKWKDEERVRRREAKGLPAEGSDLEDDSEEDDAAGWDNWNVEEEDSDDSGGWIDVESDQEIEVSDSDDENAKPNPNKKVKFAEPASDDKENTPKDGADALAATAEAKQISKLATTRILTPADLAKLQELRTTSAVSSLLPSQKTQRQKQAKQTNSQSHVDDPLTAEAIEGLSSLSRGKLSKEEKATLLAEHKADHAEHKSKAAKKKERKEAEGKSTTNKEKARKKNFLMTLGKAKRKGKRSLVEQGKVLKMHVDRGKRGGKRGNR